jgi:hypothetical protein
MFKKFSSLLIIFAFAISLTGLSVTENAQGCGDDPSVKSVGGGDGSFETWVDIWAEDSHLESNLFDESFEYAETDYNNPRIQPDRFIFCKLSISFN